MADYYPLISRAVAGLEKSTGENRRALYERARKALVDQLRGVSPALSETDITRERLALEEAIRKVETESARAMRQAPMEKRAPRVEEPTPASRAENDDAAKDDEGEAPKPSIAPDTAPGETIVPSPAEVMRRSERHWLDKKIVENSEGIKGFGDVVADAESLGDAVAQAGRSAREAFTQVPSPSPEFDRLEPRIEPEQADERPRAPERPRPPERPLAERARPQADRPRAPQAPRPSGRPSPPQPRADLGPVIGDDDDARYRSAGTHSLEPPAMPDNMRYGTTCATSPSARVARRRMTRRRSRAA
jgi:hypothetical protein